MDLRLRDSIVLVTGASRGLGLETAKAFASEGARVAICARDATRLGKAVEEIRAVGEHCIGVRADLTTTADCERVIDETATAYGGLNVLVNNASTSADAAPSSVLEMTDEQILGRLHAKTMAAIRCSRAAVPTMRRSGWGRIVCIGGTSARTVFRPGELPVSASTLGQAMGNVGVVAFAKHLSEEVAADGITVNVVHPHIVRTDRFASRIAELARQRNVTPADAEALFAAQIPIGRIVEPADLVPLILLFGSPPSAAITGQAVIVDGGALRAFP